MTDFTALLQQGHAWFFIPSAILLGILHGLEPGHSKTMMAAFIIAIKGSVRQAVMLGLAATLSHTAVVWLIAIGGMYISQQFTAENIEPWLQLFSAIIILGTAGWMFMRTWNGERSWMATMEQGHGDHHDDSQPLTTHQGPLTLAIFEQNQPPRFRIHAPDNTVAAFADATLTLTREDGGQEQYQFAARGDFLESTRDIPEPHQFAVSLALNGEAYTTEFHEHHHPELDGLAPDSQAYQDAHQRAHASDIERRFAHNKEVTNWQILLFGLTGGLMPCPAAVTVLLICIQLKALTLGATLVVCFSIGLALTLVTVGVGAAISVQQAAKRWSGFNTLARRAPYLSSGLIGMVGMYMAIHGYLGIMG